MTNRGYVVNLELHIEPKSWVRPWSEVGKTVYSLGKDGFSLTAGKALERKGGWFLLVFLKPWVRPWSEVGRIVYISGHRWCSIKPRQGAGAKKCLIFTGFPLVQGKALERSR